MQEEPIISIIMPTYNSERTIDNTLKSIRNQSYNQKKIEILVLDGGSTDSTKFIAEQYGAKILFNEKKLPEAAKELGIQKCSGKYAVYLDSDEIIINNDSFKKRVAIFEKNPELKVITATGKISKKEYNTITKYSNYISDPFSYFMYNLNGNDRFKELSKKYRFNDCGEYVLFNYNESDIIPLFDAALNMFDADYVRKEYEQAINKSNFVANIFSNIVAKTRQSGMLKDDYIYHDPNESFKSFKRKMKWRVFNNVFQPKGEGIGFAARNDKNYKLSIKKVMYVLYSCLVIPVLLHSIYISLINKNLGYMVHFFYNEYIVFWIIVFTAMKVVGYTPKRKKGYAK